MGPGPSQRPPARCRRWLGWTRDVPTIAIGVDDDVATVLCLRRQSVITASGRSILPPGTARDGRVRAAGPAVEALSRLRTELDLPGNGRVVLLIQPRSAEVTGEIVRASVDAEEVSARARLIEAAGFATPTLDPVPAAVARLAEAGPGPVYAEAAGWRIFRDSDHLEIEPSDRVVADAIIGPSPVERRPLTEPGPVAVDRGVVLAQGWSLLLGAALAGTERAPIGRIDEVAPAPVGGWTIERVTDRVAGDEDGDRP